MRVKFIFPVGPQCLYQPRCIHEANCAKAKLQDDKSFRSQGRTKENLSYSTSSLSETGSLDRISCFYYTITHLNIYILATVCSCVMEMRVR